MGSLTISNLALTLFLVFMASRVWSLEINLLYGPGFGGSTVSFGQITTVKTCINPDDQPNACDFLRRLSDYFEHVRLSYTELDNSEANSITLTFALAKTHPNVGAFASIEDKVISFNQNIDFENDYADGLLQTGLHEYMHIFGFVRGFNLFNNLVSSKDTWLGSIGWGCANNIVGAQELILTKGSHLDKGYKDLMTPSGYGWIKEDGLGIGACMFSDMYNEPLIDIGAQLIAPLTSDITLHVENYMTQAKGGFNAENIEVVISYPQGTTPVGYPDNCFIEGGKLNCQVDSLVYNSYEVINFKLSDGDNTLDNGQYNLGIRVWHLDPHSDPQPLNNSIQAYFTVTNPDLPPVPIEMPAIQEPDGGGGATHPLFLILLFFLLALSKKQEINQFAKLIHK